MLKGINKLLKGDILKALSDMGHGDVLAIVDANYPAQTMGKKVITCSGSSATALLEAILQVFPLDHIVKEPVLLMEMEPEDRVEEAAYPRIWDEFSNIIRSEYGNERKIGMVSRKDFYSLSKNAFVIVQTGEERLYGNVLIVKGVVR